MNKRVLVALVFAASAGAEAQIPRGCNALPGPGPAGADTLSPKAVAESIAVLAALEKELSAHPRNAAVWYRRAMVAWAVSASPQERKNYHPTEYTKYRALADKSFLEANRLEGNIQYLISAGHYYLSSAWTVSRAASYGYFDEALKLARKTDDRARVGEVAIDVGRISWREYDEYSGRGGMQTGEQAFLRAQAYFREAYEAQPNDPRMYHHYSMLLAEGSRWPELEALARDRLTRLPKDGWGWMAVGLALQRRRKTDHAKAVFDTALAFLPPAERVRLDRFDRVLRRGDAATYLQGDSATRAQTEETAWLMARPLWSQKDLAPRVEFLARITYAELRWTVPERGARGADSDRGNVYVRYGPPLGTSGAAQPASSTMDASVGGRDVTITHAASAVSMYGAPTSWVTPAGRFTFSGYYGNPCFDPYFALPLIEARPSNWDNVSDFVIDSMPIQVARFRSGADSVDVFIAAEAPVARMRAAATANTAIRGDLWLYGWATDNALHDSVNLATSGAMRWTPRLPEGRYHYRLEAAAEGGRLASRAAASVEIGTDPATGFAMRGFGISDLLLATRATPRGMPVRWSDIDVTPVLAGVATAGELSLVWETYELGQVANSARYRVSITMQRETRGPTPVGRVAAQIVNGIAGAVGVSRREEQNSVTFQFDRELPFSATLVDNVTLALGNTPPGSYRLTLSVTDRVSGRVTSRATRIAIRDASQPSR